MKIKMIIKIIKKIKIQKKQIKEVVVHKVINQEDKLILIKETYRINIKHTIKMIIKDIKLMYI